MKPRLSSKRWTPPLSRRLPEAKRRMAATADLMRNITLTCARTVKAGNDDIDLIPLAGLVRDWSESEKKHTLF